MTRPESPLVNANIAQMLLDEATPGHREYGGDKHGPFVRMGNELMLRFPGFTPAQAIQEAALIASAPNLATTVLDLHKRVAAFKCQPEGAASERWACSRDGWFTKSGPRRWRVKRAYDGPEWLVYDHIHFVYAAPCPLDAMRWCDAYDAKHPK